MRLKKFPKPMCAKCGKPVDELEVTPNNLTMQVEFTVKCHGEYQTANIDQFSLMNGSVLEIGPVFTEKAVEA